MEGRQNLSTNVTGWNRIGREPIICNMDGDRYIVRIPSISTISAILALKDQNGLPTAVAAGFVGETGIVRKKDAKYVYLNSGGPNDPVDVYDIMNKLPQCMEGEPNLERYGIRLMLEPLDSHGYITHDLECNPNGSIVEGGCLYWPDHSVEEEDGASVLRYKNVSKMLEDGSLKLEDVHLEDGLFIGDTSEDADPLEWICCNGRLVSKNILCSSSLPYLWQNGYVVYASRSVY